MIYLFPSCGGALCLFWRCGYGWRSTVDVFSARGVGLALLELVACRIGGGLLHIQWGLGIWYIGDSGMESFEYFCRRTEVGVHLGYVKYLTYTT